MPELPEVETTVRALRPHLPGKQVDRAWLRHASLYRRGSLSIRCLVERSFDRVERVGKNAVFFFSPGGLMLVNLGMTGRLLTCDGGAEPEGLNRRHLHMRMDLGDGRELRFYDARRFGHIFVAEAVDFARDLGIGPAEDAQERRGEPIADLCRRRRVVGEATHRPAVEPDHTR